MNKTLITSGIIAIVIIVAGFVWTLVPSKESVTPKPPLPVKEQAPINEGMTATTTNGVSFFYPEKLPTSYINTAEWPPQIKVLNGPYVCTTKAERVIDGKKFCVTEEAEGAAGSTYTTYTYISQFGNKALSTTFTLRAVQCANYDEPKASECTMERASFSVDSLVSKIIETIKVL